MPPAKNLSEEQIREIVALRGKESPQSVRKRFGIGTQRLYKIWKEHNAIPPSAPKQSASATAPTRKKAACAMAPTRKKATFAISAIPKKDVDLGAYLPCFEEKEDVALDAYLQRFEEKEDGILEQLEEKEDGILRRIERNCKALREKTDEIVLAADAAKSAVVGVVQVVGICFAVAASGFAFFVFVLPKLK